MPPKRRPEQYDKNSTNKSQNTATKSQSNTGKHNRNSTSPPTAPSAGKPFARGSQSPPSGPAAGTVSNWRLSRNATRPDYKSRIETLWKNMNKSRTNERQDAIKNGLIADPNKRTTLANAIRVVGTCPDMCPEFERVQRIRENAVDRAEKVTAGGGVKVADEYRMVKAFHRPDAGKEEQLPSDLRPPSVLRKAVRFLLDKVASPTSSLADHHKFIWDRTRCIRNDFTIQASSKLEDIKIAIECYEKIARFHILSLHQMPKIGKDDYDPQQELEQLSATLLTLFEYYDDNRGKYEAPREAEFRAYKLLIDIRSRTNDTLERVQTWPARIRDSFQVQTAVQLCIASGRLFTDTASMLSPYSRAMRVEQVQYEKFWAVLESPKVDYLMACAASVSFNEIRGRILETMARVYRSGPQSKLQDVSLEELTYSLGLDSTSQTRKLLRESGLVISKHSNGVSYLDLDETPGPIPKASIAAVEQIFSRSIVEVKREDRLFRAIYQGFDAPYCRENGLIDETDVDPDFDPDAEDVDSEDGHEDSLFVEDDDAMDEEAEEASNKRSHPFSSANPVGSKPSAESVFSKPASVTPFASFGHPSGGLSTAAAATPTPSPFSPFAKSSTNPDPFAQAKAPEIAETGTKVASAIFGQPTAFPKPVSSVFANPSASTLGSVMGAPVSDVKPPIFSSKPADVKPAPVFSWVPPTSSNTSMLTSSEAKAGSEKQDKTPLVQKQLAPNLFSSSGISSTSVVADKETKDPTTPTITLTPPVASIFSTAAKSNPHGSTPSDNKPASSIFFSNPTPSIFASQTADHTPPATSIFASTTIKPMSDVMAKTDGQPLKETPSVSNVTPPATTANPFAAFSNSTDPKVSSSKISSSSSQLAVKPEPIKVPPTPTVTQPQIDKVLELIARDILLGQYGILEQFVEAELGPIYDKARKKITRERIRQRLEDIKHSLLGSKYFIAWKTRVDEKIRRRKAIQRRKRMRQSHADSVSSEQSGASSPGSLLGSNGFAEYSSRLKYMNSDFHEIFNKSISSERNSPPRKRPASVLEQHDDMMMSGALSGTTSRSQKRSRHSRSQTVDSSSRMTSTAPSSASMPPPNGFTRRGIEDRKSFVGTGYLQNAALRREAIDFARRTGSSTSTTSDYFRLKARNIDPETTVVPAYKKRGQDLSSSEIDHSLLRSRRRSESTNSAISLSESTRELLAKSKLSESTRSMLNENGVAMNTASTKAAVDPEYDEDEDEIFAGARKLGQTMTEDIEWMRSLREQYEKEAVEEKETTAQRRLREFKATPSKTSVRLRQTLANGLLPPDYFLNKLDTEDQEHTRKDKLLDTPTPKSCFEVSANKRDIHAKARTMARNSGASMDDAIEL